MKYWKALMAAAMLFGLSSCGGGDDSDKNDPPPSPSTPPGWSFEQPSYNPGAAGSAEDPMMTVNFTVNSQSAPVTGLQLGGMTLVQLIEDDEPLAAGAPGKPEAPVITRWQSMFNKWRKKPSGVVSADTQVVQATTNDMTANGAFVDNGGGSYTLKIFKIPFSATGDITTDPVTGDPLVFDQSRTTRIGFQFVDVAGNPVKANPTYDWVPAGGTVHTREMADTQANCYACHDQGSLAMHGGKRFEVKYCVTCHNPGTTGYGEAYTYEGKKNTFPLDMSQMIHKLHRGKDLPSVNEGAAGGVDGAQYLIYGNKDSQHRYAYNEPSLKPDAGQGVFYPQDTRNCSTCHDASNPNTPDAKNWYEKPDARTCKSCHDNSQSHHVGEACTNCHAYDVSNKANAKNVHEGRVAALKAGAATLQILIEHASYDPAAKQAMVDVRVLKDGTGIGFSELKPFVYGPAGVNGGNPGILLNWNAGEGNGLAEAKALIHLDPAKGSCAEDGAGGFQCTLNIEAEVPADAMLVVTNADWALCVDRKAMDPGTAGIPALKACSEIASKGDNPKDRFVVAANVVHAEFDQGSTPLTTDQFVDKAGADMASCKGCHKDQEFHKNASSYYHSVKEFVQCSSCHNATRAAYYPGIPADLKYHVHGYHKYGAHRAGAAPDAEHGATFPASQNNCESCHTQEQYNLPNQVNARPSLALAFDGAGKPLGNKYFSPTLVACASCHLKSPLGKVNVSTPAAGDEWASHMQENGAVFGAATAEEATGREECASCHAIGQEQGVDKVHKVFDFR